MQTSLQHMMEVLQLQQQQQGTAAAPHGLPHPVDGEEGGTGPGRADAAAPEDQAVGVMRAAPRCAICHYRKTRELCAPPCGHVFHRPCLSRLQPGIAGRKVCPVCRTPFNAEAVLNLFFDEETVAAGGPPSESGPPSELGDAETTAHDLQVRHVCLYADVPSPSPLLGLIVVPIIPPSLQNAAAAEGTGDALTRSFVIVSEAVKRVGQAARIVERTGERIRCGPACEAAAYWDGGRLGGAGGWGNI
eukprot:GHVU01083507.1.p1 GENE.GHVU01083507.1~~GHVU01083507.1.p1  ORF type:complete len:246 (+),score=36.85 GHVU01083507.1:3-740(+)